MLNFIFPDFLTPFLGEVYYGYIENEIINCKN